MRFPLVLALSLIALTGCSSTKADYSEMNDPLEGLNRAVFGLNTAADILFIGPAAHIYSEATPEPIQGVVRNFTNNLKLPLVAINKLLQGNLDGFGVALGRFLVNSTAGVAGLADIATGAGLPYQPTDFGATLASWGAEPAFYIVLPLFGPSNLRDSVGMGVDTLADPVRWFAREEHLRTEHFAVGTLAALDKRASLDAAIRDARSNSLDSYATLRSYYSQSRAAELKKQFGATLGQ
jgi:phospholipid-binding lipoprotein MlaA